MEIFVVLAFSVAELAAIFTVVTATVDMLKTKDED